MRTTLLLGFLCAAAVFGAEKDFNGRWIIAPQPDDGTKAFWLEIEGAGTGSVRGKAISMQPGGQLDPISDARISGKKLSFQVDRMSGQGDRARMTHTLSSAELVGDELHGQTDFRGNVVKWIGHRSPVITDKDDGTWAKGTPIALFDGSNLKHWTSLHPGRENEWYVEGGVTKNREHADVLTTKDKFWNFELVAEYRVLPGMNGGIGLRGRYEVQIYDDHGREPDTHSNGTLYSRAIPPVNASKKAGEWQKVEIRFVGRDLTVTLNGTKYFEKITVDGFTAMASDWHEADPGPITLQGDHGAVEFRSIVLTPLVKK